MGTPFSLKVMQNQKTVELNFLESNNLRDIEVSNAVHEVEEYTEFSFIFTSEQSADRMFMDGFDILEIPDLQVDDNGNSYLAVSQKEVCVYQPHIKNTPLIPGYYEISILTEQTTFFTWLKVNSKNVSQVEWELMKNEIEDTLLGLAHELIKRNNSQMDNAKDIQVNLPMMQKLEMLEKDLGKINGVFESLEKHPRSKIEKVYNWEMNGKKAAIDSKTIKEMTKHPEKVNYIYAATRKVNYDSLENRWLKFILLEYSKFSMKAIEYLDRYADELNKILRNQKYNKSVYKDSLIEVLSKKKLVKKFNSFVSVLLNTKWLTDVKGDRPKYFSKILVLDLRYNNLYKLYLKLVDDDYKSRLNEQFQYYWKRSDLLYEIWGYIRVMKALVELGYTPVRGWLFDNNSLVLPFLTEDTQVRFEKNNDVVNLTYNQVLAKNIQQTHMNKPLYTKSSNNKPDIRLDVIKDGIYSGSLIVDTKYRPLKNIWSSSSYAKKAMDQLRNYRNATDSNLYLKGSDIQQNLIDRMRPVDEVWAMFPHHGESKITNDPYIEEHILLFEHSPNSQLVELSDELERFISNTIK
ncbi:nuclease domain-containing protein [Listeria booriae]|uniref:DUF2357 domain-containing protein n=1 Tax=Listeria booriae TaxID=1552123 RepID=UPI0028808B63|nr:DUF2357 domain-containing protein [Listeria booriae]MDT0110091.1 nuclease domain-containing protein [Listeria booriae]